MPNPSASCKGRCTLLSCTVDKAGHKKHKLSLVNAKKKLVKIDDNQWKKHVFDN